MTDAGRRIMALIIGTIAVAFVVYRQIAGSDPQTFLTCNFTEPAGAATGPTPSRNNIIRQLRVEGRIAATTERRLFSFDGSATWADSGDRSATVSGMVFRGEDDAIEALSLTVSHPGFRGRPLSIATLNREGILDDNRTAAFLYFAAEERLSHPVRYTCSSEQR